MIRTLLRRPLRASRNYSTPTARPHPLSSPSIGASRGGPAGAKGVKSSNLTAIALATFVGTAMYAIGLSSGSGNNTAKAAVLPQRTAEGFAEAMLELKAILPEDCISEDRETLEGHSFSAWTYHPPSAIPGAVLYPRSTADVVEIVKLAGRFAIPLVPFAGGTSLEGHFTAPNSSSNPNEAFVNAKLARGEKVELFDLAPGLAWCLDFSENMGNIVQIHEDDLDIVVQPGVGYEALNAELKERGIPLMFPVDPAPGAMIGGMCGTGCSGTNAVRYGTMRENVLNVTIVLPSGEVIKTRSRAKKSSVGPDLTKLFIGSEGTLGIITEATLKLYPVLPTSVAVCSFPSIVAAAETVKEIIQAGIAVSCVELLDDVMIQAINAKNKSGGSTRVWEEKPTLFLKLMEGDIERTRAIALKNGGSKKFVFAKDQKECDDIWYSRKVALWSAMEFLPGSRCWTTDVCVPISQLPVIIAEIQADTLREGIVGPIVSHAGDGNIHSLLLFRNDEELKKVEGLVHRMIKRAQELGGTCTGEHGIGQGKIKYMEGELGSGTVGLLRDIKEMIDPQNIMNPGKLIPKRKEA